MELPPPDYDLVQRRRADSAGKRQRPKAVDNRSGYAPVWARLVCMSIGRVQERPRHVARRTNGWFAGLGLALVTVVVAVGVWLPHRTDPLSRSAPAASAGAWLAAQAEPAAKTLTRDHWRTVLERLDHRREQAWRHGDVTLLKAVFAPRSAAFTTDAAMLRAYARRGLRVDGVSLGFDAVAVADRGPRHVQLEVVDQLGPAVARSLTGNARLLPTDQPTRQVLQLRRARTGWLIWSVRHR